MALLSGFALLTGLRAMVGLYAVMTLVVARRTREMGIHMALGATRSGVVRHAMAGGLGAYQVLRPLGKCERGWREGSRRV